MAMNFQTPRYQIFGPQLALANFTAKISINLLVILLSSETIFHDNNVLLCRSIFVQAPIYLL